MHDKDFGWRALKKAKAKKQSEPLTEAPSEAERLFFLFFPEAAVYKGPSPLLPFDPITYV
jgi:hypothetical protein